MGTDAWIVLAILIAAMILFISEWLRVDLVAMGVVIALMVFGALEPDEAFSGFSNPVVLTMAALFVVGGGVLQTGLAGVVGRRLLRIAGNDERRLIAVLMTAVAILSSVISDTGTVAVLLPVTIILARGARIPASKLLMPLAFGSLIGGATTLIGTPPNLIVNDVLLQQGLKPFSFFSFTPMGFVLVLAGISYMTFLGRRMLPIHAGKVESQRITTPQELIDLYQLPNNLYRLRVRKGSELVDRSIADSRLGQDFNVTVLGVLRPKTDKLSTESPPTNGSQKGMRPGYDSLAAGPKTEIQFNDLLLVQGEPDDIAHVAAVWDLGVQPAKDADEDTLLTEEVGIAEIIIAPRSNLVGSSLVDIRFGTRYGLTVLGINRPGIAGRLSLKETPLQFGDVLLVQGPWRRILALRREPRNFVVMGQPETMLVAPKPEKALIAFMILVMMLILMVSKLVAVSTASLLAAFFMVLSGCLSMDDAYQSVDWRSLVLIAGMLPLSLALEKTDVISIAAHGLSAGLGNYGPLVMLGGLFLLTSLLTQVLSNTATTVLIAPIAFAAASELGIRPYAFLMAVSIAASMAFASPVASPVNTLVMAAGNYRFSDYLKLGVPMILACMILTILVLPVLWPF